MRRLTGNDFIKKLMTPIPPAAVLFLLQSGYSATLVMQIAVDSVNGVANESRRAGMTRPGDPEFARLTQLLYELQLANALQIRIERSKDNSETAVIGLSAHTCRTRHHRQDRRDAAHPAPVAHQAGAYQVRYGGWSGKPDEIAIVTRSMLQVMLELGILAQVPEATSQAAEQRPAPASAPSPAAERPPLLNIRSGSHRRRPSPTSPSRTKGAGSGSARTTSARSPSSRA